MYPVRDYLEVDEGFLAKVCNINFNSVFWMCQHMVRARREQGGAIINIGSIEAVLPFKEGLAHYTTSKAGVIALTRDLAREYGKRFRVNVIVPGRGRAHGARALQRPLDLRQRRRRGSGRRVPLRLTGKPAAGAYCIGDPVTACT